MFPEMPRDLADLGVALLLDQLEAQQFAASDREFDHAPAAGGPSLRARPMRSKSLSPLCGLCPHAIFQPVRGRVGDIRHLFAIAVELGDLVARGADGNPRPSRPVRACPDTAPKARSRSSARCPPPAQNRHGGAPAFAARNPRIRSRTSPRSWWYLPVLDVFLAHGKHRRLL